MIEFLCLILVCVLHLFFFALQKTEGWEESGKSVFECGFTSYFFSRFSFSIHYFLIALTFLFLDLELCYLLPFFSEEGASAKVSMFFTMFTCILTLILLLEWKAGLIDWKQ